MPPIENTTRMSNGGAIDTGLATMTRELYGTTCVTANIRETGIRDRQGVIRQ